MQCNSFKRGEIRRLHSETANLGARDSTLRPCGRIQRPSKHPYQDKERGRRKGNKIACLTHYGKEQDAWLGTKERGTCAQPVASRAMPENEISPAIAGDISFSRKGRKPSLMGIV